MNRTSHPELSRLRKAAAILNCALFISATSFALRLRTSARRADPAEAGLASAAIAAKKHSSQRGISEHSCGGERQQGEMLLDLAQKDFRVYDNGVEQSIENFDLGGEPVSVVIVVETSSRIEALLPAIRKTGIVFTQTVLGATGDAAVIGYNDDVSELLKFTADPDAIEKTLQNLQEGNSGARLYDALSLAVQTIAQSPGSATARDHYPRGSGGWRKRTKTGPGAARGSARQHHDLFRGTFLNCCGGARAAKSTADAIGHTAGDRRPAAIPGQPQAPTLQQGDPGNVDLLALATWAVQHATATVKDHPLEVATIATGGLYQSAVRDNSIEDAIDRIGGELHAAYMLSYRPRGTDPAG